MATISHRYAKANNEYKGAEFDPGEESKFISYLDAKNLYGWAISKLLPTSGFECISVFLQVDKLVNFQINRKLIKT